jgi:hypothetical protein
LHAVRAFEQRHDDADLRLLFVFALQISSHQQIELLIRAAEFDIRFERDRIVSLHERVEQFMQRDGFLFRQPLLKIVALQNLFDRDVHGQTDEAFRAELVHPFRVETNFGLRGIEQFVNLLLVSLGVRVDLCACELRARR